MRKNILNLVTFKRALINNELFFKIAPQAFEVEIFLTFS